MCTRGKRRRRSEGIHAGRGCELPTIHKTKDYEILTGPGCLRRQQAFLLYHASVQEGEDALENAYGEQDGEVGSFGWREAAFGHGQECH